LTRPFQKISLLFAMTLKLQHNEAMSTVSTASYQRTKSGHTEEEFEKKLEPSSRKHNESHTVVGKYIKDIIYGGLDGLITTFAIVSGVAGASLPSSIILILGVANLLADGFSMAVGNYMGTKAEIELARKERKREEYEVEHCPEEEIEEIRCIYRKKGFSGDDLDRVVEIITSNKKVWVDTMMVEELGILDEEESPFASACATFFSFLLVGMIPLITYIIAYFYPPLLQDAFRITVTLTGITIFTLGAWKSQITSTNWFRSGAEMFLVGGFAALVAYYVGYYLSFIDVSNISESYGS